MLVLTRDTDQKVNLYLTTPHGQKLLGSVMLVKVRRGGKVRLGFEFGDEVQVLREEVGPPRKPEAA